MMSHDNRFGLAAASYPPEFAVAEAQNLCHLRAKSTVKCFIPALFQLFFKTPNKLIQTLDVLLLR